MRSRPAALLLFLALGACAADGDGAGGDGGPDGGGADAGAPARLAVVTLNTHSFQEGPDSLAKLEQIGAGLAALDADLVGLNEVMRGEEHDGVEILRGALEEASGVPWHAAAFGFAHWESGEEMTNVLLSKTPIERADDAPLTTTDFWPAPDEQRNVIYGRTTVPGVGAVNAFVTHTWGWDSADTEIQIDEVKAFMLEKRQGAEAFEILLGDLNVPPDHPAYDRWLAAPAPLADAWPRAHPGGPPAPTTADGEHRIDYVLFDPDGRAEDAFLAFDGVERRGLRLPVVSDHFAVVAELRP